MSPQAASLPPFAAASRPGALRSARTGTAEIAYWRGGAGAKAPAVLFLHGLGWDGTLWWPFVERYLERFDVICPDTRGHGRSGKPRGPYTIELFAADLLALLDGLRIARAAVVGLSQGGMTAQLLALRAPQRVGALALIATAARTDPATAANMEARIRAQREAGPEAAARLAAAAVFSPQFLERAPGYLEAFIAWRAAMDAAALESAMRAGDGYDVLAALAAIRVPTLVVAGAADRLVPPPATRAIAEAVPGARYVEIEASGHLIVLEQPDALGRSLDPFLDAYR
jgi:3-oxoadipate enol-lactonase